MTKDSQRALRAAEKRVERAGEMVSGGTLERSPEGLLHLTYERRGWTVEVEPQADGAAVVRVWLDARPERPTEVRVFFAWEIGVEVRKSLARITRNTGG